MRIVFRREQLQNWDQGYEGCLSIFLLQICSKVSLVSFFRFTQGQIQNCLKNCFQSVDQAFPRYPIEGWSTNVDPTCFKIAPRIFNNASIALFKSLLYSVPKVSSSDAKILSLKASNYDKKTDLLMSQGGLRWWPQVLLERCSKSAS